MDASTDRIERSIELRAPLARVWEALSDSDRFGEWFRIDFHGRPFVAGTTVEGTILHPGMEHLNARFQIEAIEPPRQLVFRWHPYAIDPAVDYSDEATTQVSFTLEDIAGGTRLHLVESGFDALPQERRAEAWRMNSGGWDQQMNNIARYVHGS